MKSIIGVISLAIILGLIFILHKKNTSADKIEGESGLVVPSSISDSKYQHERLVDESNYPYIFFDKFKIAEAEYFTMVKSKLISRLDSNNVIYANASGKIFKNKDFFWGFDTILYAKIPAWWIIPNKLDPRFLFANVFSDKLNKEIGNINSYNGKIVSYYNKPYCFLMVKCWPSNGRLKPMQ